MWAGRKLDRVMMPFLYTFDFSHDDSRKVFDTVEEIIEVLIPMRGEAVSAIQGSARKGYRKNGRITLNYMF